MSNGTNPTAYDYFRAGRDTADIASIMNISEPEAHKQVSQQRSALLGLDDPYHPKAAERISYAERREQMRRANFARSAKVAGR